MTRIKPEIKEYNFTRTDTHFRVPISQILVKILRRVPPKCLSTVATLRALDLVIDHGNDEYDGKIHIQLAATPKIIFERILAQKEKVRLEGNSLHLIFSSLLSSDPRPLSSTYFRQRRATLHIPAKVRMSPEVLYKYEQAAAVRDAAMEKSIRIQSKSPHARAVQRRLKRILTRDDLNLRYEKRESLKRKQVCAGPTA